MSGDTSTDALYALFEDWFQKREGVTTQIAVDTVEVQLPRGVLTTGSAPIKVGELSELAKRAYDHRRVRDRIFQEDDLFGEPVWDMLLDIAVADGRGVHLSVTSACIGACVAETTALRWLKVMEVRGLTSREADPRDGRRSFIRLTDDGRKKLDQYFNEIEQT